MNEIVMNVEDLLSRFTGLDGINIHKLTGSMLSHNISKTSAIRMYGLFPVNHWLIEDGMLEIFINSPKTIRWRGQEVSCLFYQNNDETSYKFDFGDGELVNEDGEEYFIHCELNNDNNNWNYVFEFWFENDFLCEKYSNEELADDIELSMEDLCIKGIEKEQLQNILFVLTHLW